MRFCETHRNTNETQIKLLVNVDGKGDCIINTGVGFLDHMLTLFAKHANFDLQVTCKGDTNIDDHHSVEDIGIVLGDAFATAMGEKRGILRYGHIILPMDEALILAAVDLSGRGVLNYELDIPTEKVGTFDTQLCEEFFLAFTRQAKLSLHLQQLAGKNSHHIIEGTFKAVARALKQAVTRDPNSDTIPSTKGVL